MTTKTGRELQVGDVIRVNNKSLEVTDVQERDGVRFVWFFDIDSFRKYSKSIYDNDSFNLVA